MEFVNQLHMQIIKTASGIKIIACLALLSFFHLEGFSQNVGVGTSSPQRKLTVRGSIMLDQGNHNTGTLDSAALVFGSGANVGITSQKSSGVGQNGLSFWTSGAEKMVISASGNLGVNGSYNNSYKLYVNDGNSYFDGNATVNGSVTATGDVTADDMVANDAIRAERVGIGGSASGSYSLYVHSGNSYFQGNISASGNATVNGNITVGNTVSVGNDLNVSGTINATNNMVIKGTGSVRSEGPSPLRVGFESYTISPYYDIAAGDYTTVILNLPDFDDESDIRVLFSDYAPSDPVYYGYVNRFRFSVYSYNATNNTCAVRIHNYSNADALISGVLHFVTIIKDN
jgi:cytoskeletal protein CcmA (bactofilin family)